MHVSDPLPGSPATASAALYRRIWRWHFFAALVCMPVILLLAVTGALYLFHQQIDDLVYGSTMLRAPSKPAPAAPPSVLVASALRTFTGRASAFNTPADARHNAQVDVLGLDGVTLQVFVDPASGHVAGAIAASSRLMTTVKHIHSLTVAGTAGNVVIEIVAGWVMVLICTGAYLWWPRGRQVGVLAIRAGARGRIWWRDLHALTGAFGGSIILFLALTGMPWSVFWGQNVNAWMTAHGLGVPTGMWSALPQSKVLAGSLGAVPWSQQQLPLPASDPHAAHRAMGHAFQPAQAPDHTVSIDQIAARLPLLGMTGAWQLALPTDAGGVYSAIQTPGPVAQQRVIHFDQYSGKVLLDLGGADIGTLGRITEWGISVHQGQQYGWPNLLLMLAGCLALIGLCVSGVVMWWSRRPRGQLAAPARPADDALAPGVLLIAVVLGCVFPLLGASMLAVLAVDALLGIFRARRR
ncbi:PepSY-associated TM helix domain-containing protein [Massilia sp. PWRC2]|uniref:PepSY-associated TM helix domain-containing protein n=1 Tax=Massilia sp. PWRC2 TaxID=2804626 RepID=UPI003CF9DE49